MYTLYWRWPTFSSLPSRPAPPSRPVLHPASASAATTAQTIAARGVRRGAIGRGSLPTDHARARAEAGRLQRLESGHARARERARRSFLEDHAQPVERGARLAPQPATRAQLLLERLPRSAGLTRDRQLDAGDGSGLSRALPDHLTLGT